MSSNKKKTFVVEREEDREDYKLVVIFGSMGHRCGYVGVPKTHPIYGIEYHADLPENLKEIGDALENAPIGKRGPISVFCIVGRLAEGRPLSVEALFNVHGSLTYSGGRDYPVDNPDNKWWFFGFDCGHFGDCPDMERLEELGLPKRSTIFLEGEVRTTDYAWKECESLYKQLKELETYVKE